MYIQLKLFLDAWVLLVEENSQEFTWRKAQDISIKMIIANPKQVVWPYGLV